MCNKKVHSDELCKKYGKRAGGRWHIFLDAQLFRKWFSKKLCNKKFLNLLCILFFLFRAGDFSKKNWDNTFFLWGALTTR